MTMFVLALMLLSLAAVTSAQKSMLGDLSNPDRQVIQLVEGERREEYKRLNYTWPLGEHDYRPDLPGWKELMAKRFHQVEEMPQRGARYEGYIQTIHSAFLVPNFTEHGFSLTRCPDELINTLRKAVREGQPTAVVEEKYDVINGPEPPLFVDRPDLTHRVLHELHPYVEEWSGMELTPYRAYGFRLYQNNSQLTMHIDKMQTHIISFILHIDSSDDAEPWPIFIEDYHGNTHEVILKPGDMLFYESSKMWHGRPKRLNGSWYCSIFTHYYPKHGWYDRNHALDAHYAVPPHWDQDPSGPRKLDRLEMIGTSMIEPDCPNEWCATKSSVKWSGPGEQGYYISPNFQKYPLKAAADAVTDAAAAGSAQEDL